MSKPKTAFYHGGRKVIYHAGLHWKCVEAGLWQEHQGIPGEAPNKALFVKRGEMGRDWLLWLNGSVIGKGPTLLGAIDDACYRSLEVRIR